MTFVDIFQCISWKEICHILFWISRMFVPKADQKNSLVSGPPTDPATTPPTVNFLQQSEQKVFLWRKKYVKFEFFPRTPWILQAKLYKMKNKKPSYRPKKIA